MIAERDKSGRFVPGNKAGRPSGLANKVNRCIKEAVVLAAESVGEDGRGRGGLVGFLRRVALKDERTFCMLVAKLMPIELRTQQAPETTYRSIEEVGAELRARGIDADYLRHMAESMAERNRSNGNGGGIN